MADTDLLVVAGEASGDLHAARMLAELRALHPELRPFGLGGDELAAAGLELLGHSREIAVVGIAEVLRVLPRAREIFDRLLAEVDRRGARTAVLVDFPEFNLRLARRLADRGVRVVYYVSPQVWAWRRGRLRTMAQKVDLMLTLFPFEVAHYERHGVPVVHVGHPLVDEVPRLAQVWQREDERAGSVRGPRVVSLLPGSRRSEVRSLLEPMVAAVRLLAAEMPDLRVRLIRADHLPDELFTALEAARAEGLAIETVPQAERFAAIAESHVALCASGTATLEVGLLETPLVVLYRLHPWSARLAKLLVRLPYFSLVNLVLEAEVVPELFQEAAEPRRIATEVARLLEVPAAREAMRGQLALLRQRLGTPGASRRAAEAVASALPGAARWAREWR
jgi:lipid-A-disaccharide synthase